MVLSETVGQRIRRLRKARQRQLGRKYRRKELAAAVGVVPAKITAWEEGREDPDDETISRLAAEFGLSEAYIRSGDNGVRYQAPGIDESLFGEHAASVFAAIGMALWFIQSLEQILADCEIIFLDGHMGMGEEEARKEQSARAKTTLGGRVSRLTEELVISDDIVQRARQLVDERNWLIHRCRSDHRHAVRPGRSADALLERLDRIHELALPVYHAIGEAVRQYVLAHGVDPLEIDREFLRDLFGDER